MRSLKKNEQNLYYARYVEKIPILDADNFETGDYETGYSKPVFFSANISAGKVTAQTEVFGKEIEFTRTVSSTDLSLPIDETSLIWYESKPRLKADGTADPDSADYTVAAPLAKGLNSVMIAIKKRQKNQGV